jgi:hypothetical protein
MTNSNNFAQSTIVAFHIGRGGRFNNPGHITFLGENKITHYTDDLFLSYENAYEIGKKIKGRENLQNKFEQALDSDTAAISFFEKIGLPLGEKIYTDCNGSPVGLTEAEAVTGIGRIDLDGQYDTTYTRLLSDCNEHELKLIADYGGYVDDTIRDYAKEQLGIVDEETED